jgi:hypothetical protein
MGTAAPNPKNPSPEGLPRMTLAVAPNEKGLGADEEPAVTHILGHAGTRSRENEIGPKKTELKMGEARTGHSGRVWEYE